MAAKTAQHGVIVGQNRHEDLGRQVLHVLRRNGNRADAGRVVDHMHDQAQKPIDEIFPGPRLAGQAALEQLAINIGE